MVKRAVVVSMLALLSLIAFCAAVAYGQEVVEPAEMLKQAVGKAKVCGSYTITRVRVDKDGNEKVLPPGEEDGKATSKLSLPLLFKRERFNLSYGPDDVAINGRAAFVILFAPREKGFELGVTGD